MTKWWLASLVSISVLTAASIPNQADGFQLRPRKVVVDGTELTAFTAAESEYLLWTFETRIPQYERVIKAYEKVDRAQLQLIRTTTTALSIHESLHQDEQALTAVWRDTAEANANALAAKTSMTWLRELWGEGKVVLWIALGAAGGIGIYKLIRGD